MALLRPVDDVAQVAAVRGVPNFELGNPEFSGFAKPCIHLYSASVPSFAS